MSPQPAPEPIERLLAERAWLRRLAGALVPDAATAEDLTQDAYLAALERAPASIRRPRAWLGTVLRNRARNRARDESRRRVREIEGRPPPEVESPDRAVARAELVERVGRLVLALPEPYRSTIVLRFFEDLPPRKVAKRQAVPVETVRTRTRRALKILEQELDALHGGRRERWLVPLLPWAGAGGALKVGAGGAAVMATKGKLSAAILVVALLIGTAGWFIRDRLGTPSVPGPGPAGEAEEIPSDPADAQLAGRAETADARATRSKTRALRIEGRVVDRERRPVEGVAVVAAGGRATTDAAGRFGLTGAAPAGEREGVAVRARAVDGRVAVAAFPLQAEDGQLDAGTLVLEAAHGFEVRVRRRGGQGVAARLLVLGLVPPAATPAHELETDAEGRAVVSDLPAGGWRLLAIADGYGRGEARVWTPRLFGGPCLIELDPPREVRLRVLDSRTDEPVSGASVALFDGPTAIDTTPRLPRRTVATTDAAGETILPGLGRDETPYLLIQGAGIARSREADGRWHYPLQLLPAAVTRFTCGVYRPTPVRWRILPGEVDAPAAGTVLRVVRTNGWESFDLRPGRVEDGHVVADDSAYGKFAVTDDGRIAHLENVWGTGKPPTTRFRRARRVTIHARDAGGRPAAGVGFKPLGGNDNPLVEPAFTDEDGIAILDGFHGGTLRLWRAHPSGSWHDPGDTLEVDLEAGDAEVDVTLRRPVEVTLRVRVDGEPRLPSDYTVFVNRILVPEVQEDPEAATLRFTWWPTALAAQIVHVESDAALLGVSTLPEDTEQAEIEIDLASGGWVFARVLPPADGRFQVALQSAGGAGWQALNHVQAVGTSVPPDGHVRFGPVAPGRYRVADLDSGVAGAAFEVATGGPPARTTLDLGDVTTVEGRVEVPEGRGYQGVRVAVLPEGLDGANVGRDAPLECVVPVRDDGRFRARVRARAGAALRAVHPVLTPDPERGTVRLSRLGEEIVLVLAARDEAVLRFDPPVDYDSRPRMQEEARLYRGEPMGVPVRKLSLTVEEGAARIAGYTPGRWTLWIDMGLDLPVVLRDVTLGTGTTDLGTASLERGSTLKARILVPEGRAPPFLGVFATRVEEPSYKRFLLFQHRETEVELTGLLPGTWKLDVLHDRADRLPKEIRVGRDEIVDLVLDLR